MLDVSELVVGGAKLLSLQYHVLAHLNKIFFGVDILASEVPVVLLFLFGVQSLLFYIAFCRVRSATRALTQAI